MRTYLLLDSIQIPELYARLYQLAQITTVHSLYLSTQYAELASIGPVLVAVEPGSALAQTFHEQWQEKAGIWLESDAAETTLVAHLRSLIHVGLEGGVCAFFRYYDPRITRLWLEDLSSEKRDRLMGPVRLIRLPNTDGSERVLRQQNPDQPCASYAATPWLGLSEKELEHLSHAQRECFSQQLIAHCQRYFPQCLQGLSPQAQQDWALGCQRNAARQGYSARDEVMAWVGLYATFGDEFPDAAEHVVYRRLLAERGVLPEQRLDHVLDELIKQSIPAQGVV